MPIRFCLTILVLVGSFAIATFAMACSCGPVHTDAYFTRIGTIVYGEVLGPNTVQKGQMQESGGSYSVRFRITRTMKGTASGIIDIYLSSRDHNVCGADLRAGNRLTVGLGKSEDGRFGTSMCGVYPLNDDRGRPALEQYLSRFLSGLGPHERRTRVDPRDAAAWRAKGDYLQTHWDLDGAREAYAQAMVAAPNDSENHVRLASALLEHRLFRQAVAAADAALQLDPANAKALQLREHALINAGAFNDLDLTSVNFAGLETYQPLSLSGRDLSGRKFDGARLGNVDFSQSVLDGASFRGVVIRGANFARASCINADFEKSQISGPTWRGARLIGARLNDAKLSYASLVEVDLTDAVGHSVDLTRADLSRSTLVGADLRGSNLRDARLEGADLSRARLRAANLIGANLSGATLTGVDFSGAQYHANTVWPAGTDIESLGRDRGLVYILSATPKQNFGPNWGSAVTAARTVPGSATSNMSPISVPHLAGQNFDGVNWFAAWLEGANLENTSLRDADLTLAMLRNASLKNADLRGADLTQAELGGADVSGALYDAKTRWPHAPIKFNPEAAGAKRVD